MNRKYDIIRFAVLLYLAAGCFHACQRNDFDDLASDDRQSLIAQGRYLASAVLAANDAGEPGFEEGTPYRLLAFTKPYSKADAANQTNTFNTPRFNKVAWEGETASGLRYINVESDPDKWFGFSAFDGEERGDDGLVSLDFYGFTYRTVESRRPDYIALDGLAGETLPDKATETQQLSSLKRTETAAGVTAADGTVYDNAELSDLMWGELLNQNIASVGHGDSGPQSVMPFKHCFSKLRFKVFQQKDDNGQPCFENIAVTNVTLTNTPTTGAVYLHNGKVELDPAQLGQPQGAAASRRELKLTSTDYVTTEEVVIGEMIVFPSDGNALTNPELADGYDVGIEITVTSPSEADMKSFLRNVGCDPATATQGEDGRWSGTIVKNCIIDNTDNSSADKHLYFRQNTVYTLVIWFVRDAVRIITVVPLVEPWVNGEGTAEDPWEEQALGQPQMFDNVVWSDRNMGADHFDPTDGTHFEHTMGYFFQGGRNIPYYPFKYAEGAPSFATMTEEKNTQHFIDQQTDWGKSQFRFYPIVDPDILLMTGNWNWTMSDRDPQMDIPETKPTNRYFDFMQNLTEDMDWSVHENQPADGLWKVPSAREFVTIFPSTPHAGNIVFNKVGQHTAPNNWGCSGVNNEAEFQMPKAAEGGTDVLRVTVPYYTSGMTAPVDGKSGLYNSAWETLRSRGDQGTTHLEQYIYNGYDGNPGRCTQYEPDGDPAPGYASVYVISRAEGDVAGLSDEFLDRAGRSRFVVREWGTIYAIKRIYTPQAYRMRWRAVVAQEGTKNPSIYIEICRYRCEEDDTLTEENYMTYDWNHPAARIYFPVCGMGDHTGEYINFGTECAYATSDPIKGGQMNALRIKITGNNASNTYMAVVRQASNRNFGMQIRPVMLGGGTVNNSK